MPAPVQFASPFNLNVGNGFAVTGSQLFPKVAALANGTFFAAWTSATQYEGAFFGSRGGDGFILGFNFQMGSSPAGASNGSIDVAALNDGSVGVAWVSGSGATAEINFQRVRQNGDSSTVITQVIAGEQNNVSIAASAQGGAVLVFRGDSGTASGIDPYRTAFLGSDAITFAASSLDTGSNVGTQEGADVAALADGRLISVWIDRSDNLVKGRFMSESGARTGSTFTLASGTPPAFGDASVSGLSDGGFVVSYSTTNNVARFAIFNQDGTTRVAATNGIVTGGAPFTPQVLGLQDGRFVMVSTAGVLAIYGQIYSSTGVADGARFDILAPDGNSNYHPSLALLPDGRFVVSYIRFGVVGGNGSDIVAQIWDPREVGVSVNGTSGADQYYGSVHIDSFNGGDGSDRLEGRGGDDLLVGGNGADTLQGGEGNDTIRGGFGADIIEGDNGIDTVSYEDQLSGVYYLAGDTSNATGAARGDVLTSIENIIGGNGNDIIGIGAGDNTLFGLLGNDQLFGQGGNDILIGGLGADVLNGDTGLDTASYENATSGVYVVLGDLGNSTGEAVGDSFISIERIRGTAFNDILSLGADNNMLWGGIGNDQLFGQDGNDVLDGGIGQDVLTGGNGFDTASYESASAGGVYYLFGDVGNATGDALGDRYISIEGITGSSFRDIIGIGDLDNVIDGGSGDDWLFGQGGNDTLIGGTGNDLYAYTGAGFGNDTITIFEDGADKVDFRTYSGANFASLTISAVVGGVSVTVGGGSIFLGGVGIGQITAADFLFA